MLNVDLKEVVRQFELILSKSGEFKEVKITVEDDYDDEALLQLQNEGYSVTLRYEDETVGIAKRVVQKLHYLCCYPKVVYGGYWEPEDVDIVEFADEVSIIDACIAIHANSFAQRIDCLGGFEYFPQVSESLVIREQEGTSILEEEV